jgi:diguanylate cyclase (GGDEF)-like protein
LPAQNPSTASLFQQTLESLPDGVLLISSEKEVIYANKAFLALWKVPTTLLSHWDRATLLEHVSNQLDQPSVFRRDVERLYKSNENSEDELGLIDGRIFSRRSVPFVEKENGLGRIWIFTDITEAWHARLDTLTGLPNRRAYSLKYPKIASAADDGFFKGVGIMDVDNFKGYNDIYGHAAGDIVLKRIGQLISSRLHGDDVAFRIGGEEFLIACKARTEMGAFAFFEALRTGIEAEGIPHQKNESGVVTASFGLAVFKGARDPEKLFEAVDAALYISKSSGRNMVTNVDCGRNLHTARVDFKSA